MRLYGDQLLLTTMDICFMLLATVMAMPYTWENSYQTVKDCRFSRYTRKNHMVGIFMTLLPDRLYIRQHQVEITAEAWQELLYKTQEVDSSPLSVTEAFAVLLQEK